THPALYERKRGVSLSTESDQRRRLWNPPPFEKGGPKLYYFVWNLIIGKTGEHSSPLRLGFLSLIWNPHPNNAFSFQEKGDRVSGG
ncbi:MAG: hypothetical protein IKV98_10380, partial [Clostridia bacterium]|nr:hypothetical protein [Clostridia bacterium]